MPFKLKLKIPTFGFGYKLITWFDNADSSIPVQGFTFTLTADEAMHPLIELTVTVYTVVAKGDTVVDAFVDPLLHVYDVAVVDAVNIAFPPTHIKELDVRAETIGNGLNTLVTVFELIVHPTLFNFTK